MVVTGVLSLSRQVRVLEREGTGKEPFQRSRPFVIRFNVTAPAKAVPF